MIDNIRNLIESSPDGRCVLNATRQIGTTTALCKYVSELVTDGKKAVYHTDRAVSRDIAANRIMDMLRESFPERAFRLNTGNRVATVCDSTSGGSVKVACGDELSTISEPAPYAYVIDNADFFEGWVKGFKRLVGSNTEVVIASCPSKFTGKWSLFKKLCVKDHPMFKVFTLSQEYDVKFRQSLSSDAYDMECNNYRSFFDVARKIYGNIGDLLFMENKPFYENTRIV